ncbi:MAG TPA: hypothetical protein VHI52_05460 [Verrucomicrobiae bacterium]|nr:hypothetical protein [Verrucomicrobiae bacterium]
MLRPVLSINTGKAFRVMVGGMKTHARAWRLNRARIWAGLGLLVVLASVQFGNVLRFDRNCGWKVGQTRVVNEVYELADLWVGR